MKGKALVIEDDEHLQELLSLDVADIGYELDTASDGFFGLEKALKNDYSFILLDLHLPGIEGLEVCKRIREKNTDVPIIVLTASVDDINKVTLIELGADDYITKPFNSMELKARIKAIMRRVGKGGGRPQNSDTFTFRNLSVDFERRRVFLDDELIELTKREFDILSLLVSKPGRPFSRSELSAAAYGYDVSGYGTSVSSHITRLRAKIEPNPEKPTFVLTIRGVGYAFTDESE